MNKISPRITTKINSHFKWKSAGDNATHVNRLYATRNLIYLLTIVCKLEGFEGLELCLSNSLLKSMRAKM